MAFCFYYHIEIDNYNINHSISFIDFFAYNGLATPTIATYISAIKAKCIQLNLTTAAWSHPRRCIFSAFEISYPKPSQLFRRLATLPEVMFPSPLPGSLFFLNGLRSCKPTDTRLIPLAAIPGSSLCPLQAILQISQLYPVSDHCPMFSHTDQGKLVIVSQSQARHVLSELLVSLGHSRPVYQGSRNVYSILIVVCKTLNYLVQ